MKRTFFITGTDTGVGKTVLTALLVRYWRESGVNAAALKPICSGGRADARKIFSAMNGALLLDEINPWHFRAAIAPLLAARKEKRRVKRSQVLAHIHVVQKRFEIVLIEGAGGLLSPLGEDFNSRDLMTALRVVPIIVAQNKLGVINQVLLTLEALPEVLRAQARVVLVSPPKSDVAAKTNARLIAEFSNTKISSLPWLGANFSAAQSLKNLLVQKTLQALIK